MNLKIVFMGTPDFAVGPLRAISNSNHKLTAVVTAPDKPAGRGMKLMPSPVKQFASELGIPVFQPENLKDENFIHELQELRADIFIVVAFRMLPEAVWSLPPRGTVNLHASLLPDYRGAAPINRVIINGEKETGVTTFFIDKDIDTGKIIYREKVGISDDMNAGRLHDILLEKGSLLVMKTIDAIAAGQHPAVPQNELLTDKPLHKAPKIYRDDCKIDWTKPVKDIHNLIRGLSPYPAAWTEIFEENNKVILKIYEGSYETAKVSHPAGTHLTDGKSYLKIAAGDGYIFLTRVQLAGRKSMGITEFLRGYKNTDSLSFA